MRKLKFVVIGKNQAIMDVLLRLLNAKEEWSAAGFIDEAEALATDNFSEFDILLLSSGIDEEAEKYIREEAPKKNPRIKILQHYGGGSGLLTNEILSALSEWDNETLI